MLASRIRWAVLSAMIGACAITTGCYAEVDAPAPVVAEGYTPQYYDGYVVYYDDGGRPYYYNGGVVAYVPPTYRGYDVLARHYQTYREPYARWHTSVGYRYRTYRRR